MILMLLHYRLGHFIKPKTKKFIHKLNFVEINSNIKILCIICKFIKVKLLLIKLNLNSNKIAEKNLKIEL